MDFSYILMTDSDAEMPYSWLAEFDIQAILMPYAVDGVEDEFNFFEGLDMAEFYQKMRDGAHVTTAQRNIEDFKAFWQPYLEAGKDILYLGLSSELSGTYNCACVARTEMLEQFPERKIIVVDTLRISAPQALLVRKAAQMRLNGASMEEVAQWVEQNRTYFSAFFMVDDLAYLKRGGRVSSATAFFGSMLDIKPILYESPAGKLEPFEKAKGRKKAIKRIVQLASENIADAQNALVVICQADCAADAALLESLIREQIKPFDIVIQPVGSRHWFPCRSGDAGGCFHGQGRNPGRDEINGA